MYRDDFLMAGLRRICTVTRAATLSILFCFPSEMRSTQTGKNLLLGSKFFSFELTVFIQCSIADKLTGSHKNGGKTCQVYPLH